MYQWRKFEFFEEKAAGRGGAGPAVPSEIASRVTCCSGGRGRVAVGCDDGTVGLLDCGFRLSYGFQAYASSVLFLQQLKQRNVLISKEAILGFERAHGQRPFGRPEKLSSQSVFEPRQSYPQDMADYLSWVNCCVK